MITKLKFNTLAVISSIFLSGNILAENINDQTKFGMIVGEWTGTYQCDQQANEINLSITEASEQIVNAVIKTKFSGETNTDFLLKGNYNPETRNLSLTPVEPISNQDSNPVSGMTGVVSEYGMFYEGQITAKGCTEFKLDKVFNLDEKSDSDNGDSLPEMSKVDSIAIKKLYTDFYRAAERGDPNKMLSLLHKEKGVKLSLTAKQELFKILLESTKEIASNKIESLEFHRCFTSAESKKFGACKIKLQLVNDAKFDRELTKMIAIKSQGKWLLLLD